MTTGRELALQLLPDFSNNVENRVRRSYGYYAKIVGRDPAKEAILIGSAMHTIGAICVIQKLPVAPLYWVERAKGEPRQIFASDPIESANIIDCGRFDTMFVVAREYHYSTEEFKRLGNALERVLVGKAPPNWTAHHLWHMVIEKKPKGEDLTFLERAMSKYEMLYADMKAGRNPLNK